MKACDDRAEAGVEEDLQILGDLRMNWKGTQKEMKRSKDTKGCEWDPGKVQKINSALLDVIQSWYDANTVVLENAIRAIRAIRDSIESSETRESLEVQLRR